MYRLEIIIIIIIIILDHFFIAVVGFGDGGCVWVGVGVVFVGVHGCVGVCACAYVRMCSCVNE